MDLEVNISVRLPRQLARRLEAEAKRTHRSRADMIRYVLDRALPAEPAKESDDA